MSAPAPGTPGSYATGPSLVMNGTPIRSYTQVSHQAIPCYEQPGYETSLHPHITHLGMFNEVLDSLLHLIKMLLY